MSKLAKKARTIELENLGDPYKHKDHIAHCRYFSKDDPLHKSWRKERHNKKMYLKFENKCKLTRLESIKYYSMVDPHYDSYSA